MGITAQVCDVHNALMGAKGVFDAGNRVVFDADDSDVEDTGNGEATYLTEKGGVLMLQLWARRTPF